MPNLPTPGGDDGTWAPILNDFLEVSLNSDGTLNTEQVNAAMSVTGYVDISDGVSTLAGTPLPSAGKYPQLHKAFAEVLSGTSDQTLLLVGDSTYLGVFADFGQGPVPYIVNEFNANGLSAAFGLSAAPNTTFSDPRWTVGTGWTQAAAPAHAGWGGLGAGFSGASAAATLSYQPDAGVFDTFDIYYLTASSTYGFKVNFNGGSDTIVNADTGSITVAKVTITGAPTSTPTCNIHTPGAFGAFIMGVEARLSTAQTLRIGNAGISGATAASWTDTTLTGYGPLACIEAYAPNLTLIALGINDLYEGTPTSTILASIATIIATCELSGSVILATETPFTTATVSQATQSAFWAAYTAFAESNGYPLVDVYSAWGTAAAFSTLHSLGYYGDGSIMIHPNASVGQPDAGRTLATGLLSL